ncbi:MAG: gamma-glutamyltransferase, partial [Pirellulaceae bacterium]
MRSAKRRRPRGLSFSLGIIVVLTATGIMTEPIKKVSAQTAGPGFDRPTGPPHQARSVVLARHGIVATSHPLAAEAGLDILKAGGNAADAAIAANAMLGVVEPMSCGIGGDMFAIYWDQASGKLYGLNASGRSPLKISRELFTGQGMNQIPLEGPLSWSIPGCVSGWHELHQRFGRTPIKQILAASIQTADEGFPVTEV